jgi:hypothetical protein
MGISIHPDWCGQGLATEMGKALIAFRAILLMMKRAFGLFSHARDDGQIF